MTGPHVIRDVDLRHASIGPDPSGQGEVLDVRDVETELAPAGTGDAPEGRCPAVHRFGAVEFALTCYEENADHPRPHRDKVHGLAWDDSPLTLPWPAHTAALVVRDLIEAGAALATRRSPGRPGRERWAAAVEVAMLLPGVVPPGEA